MPQYKAPLRDMRFVLHELFDSNEITALPGGEDFSRDVTDPILDEAAKICEEVLFPINRSGDEEGSVLENGQVRTPKGFKEAYTVFREGGLTGIACDPQYGGMGLPATFANCITEMICSANLAFGMFPGLSHGAYVALKAYGSEELKDTYLPKLVDGTWAGTMCLTEPHCGTDLGLIKTRAEPDDQGTYRVTGTKIFISGGDQDLTENLIHLVLAKLPGAPKGTAGISLFLVPKFLNDAEGRLTIRNGNAPGSLEHKMGIKASPTCVMNFDGAKGWLVGEPNKGMRAMFAMMNDERLAVGFQGLGLGEVAYQNAVQYARDRLQGRALTGVKHPDKPADPIIVHPDVRRMLLTARAYNEGCRALGIEVARALDVAERHTDPAKRQEADDYVALMTPIVKALFTDLGFEVANIGVQVFGGHGFIREHGQEQYVRDARIAMLYEGTNGIQALDLVGRKMPAHMGRYLRAFFHPVERFIEERQVKPDRVEFLQPLAKAFQRLQQATGEVARRGMGNPDEAGAAATDFLRLFGLTALAYEWARMADVALDKAGGPDDADGFYAAKVATARFYMERLLPQTGALLSTIMAGSKSIMAFEEAAF